MSNWTNPVLTSNYANVLTELKYRDDSLATMFAGTAPTNLPTNAVRLSTTAFQRWNGTSWAAIGVVIDTAAQSFTGNKTFSNNLSVGGTLTTTGAVTFSSTLTVTGNINNSSDRTLKENIETIKNPVSIVKQLNGVTFNWKKDGRPAIGLVAQDVESVLPEIVRIEDDGLRSVAYANIVAVLIEAVKELSVRIEKLENK
jgi:hypothetical protein